MCHLKITSGNIVWQGTIISLWEWWSKERGRRGPFLLIDSAQWRRKGKRGRQRGREKQIEQEVGYWGKEEEASLPWLAIYLWLYSGPSCCWFKVRSLAGNQAQDCENTHTATSHAERRRNQHVSARRRGSSALQPTDLQTCAKWKILYMSQGRAGRGQGWRWGTLSKVNL